MDVKIHTSEEIAQIAEEAARRVLAQSAPLRDGVLSVPHAARLSDYTPQGIRKLIAQKKIRNYGRPGAPRVRLGEILNLEG